MPAIVAILVAIGMPLLIAQIVVLLIIAIALYAIMAMTPTLGDAKERKAMVKSAIATRKIMYGKALISGPIVFVKSTEGKSVLNLTVAFTDHPIDKVLNLYANQASLIVNANTAEYGIDPPNSFYATYGGQHKGRFFDEDGDPDRKEKPKNNLCRYEIHYGKYTQPVSPYLLNNMPGWGSNHKLSGTSYANVRFTYDYDAYPTGIPQIRLLAQGKRVLDPRLPSIGDVMSSIQESDAWFTKTMILTVENCTLNTTDIGRTLYLYPNFERKSLHVADGELNIIEVNISGGSGTVKVAGLQEKLLNNWTYDGISWAKIHRPVWSDNWALCIRDFISNKRFGLGARSDEIDESAVINSANISDEVITLENVAETITKTGDYTFTSDSDLSQALYRGTILNIDDIDYLIDSVSYKPARIEVTETVYIPPVLDEEGQIITPGYTTTNIVQAAQIQITTVTTSTTTPTLPANYTTLKVMEKRYTVNGVLDVGATPADNLERMNSAGAGHIIYTQGKYHILAGEYNEPVLEVDETWLRENISIQASAPKDQVINSMKGVYVDKTSFYEPTDFPMVRNYTAIDDDGETLTKDLDLAYTTSIFGAQRLAKLNLNLARCDVAVNFAGNLKCMTIGVYDTIALTLKHVNWDKKVFRVMGIKMRIDGMDLELREEFPEVYDWSVLEAEPKLPIYNPINDSILVPEVTGISIISGDSTYIIQGTRIVSRLLVSWDDMSSNGTVTYRVSYYAQEDYIGGETPIYTIDTNTSGLSTYIEGILGYNYIIKVKAIDYTGNPSPASDVGPHTLKGRTAPSDVTNFNVTTLADGTRSFTWVDLIDVTVSGYSIRYSTNISDSWEAMTPLFTGAITINPYLTKSLDPIRYSIAIKAVDTSGQYSVNATFTTVILGSSGEAPETILEHFAADEFFAYTKNEFIIEDNTGYLQMSGRKISDGILYRDTEWMLLWSDTREFTELFLSDGTPLLWDDNAPFILDVPAYQWDEESLTWNDAVYTYNIDTFTPGHHDHGAYNLLSYYQRGVNDPVSKVDCITLTTGEELFKPLINTSLLSNAGILVTSEYSYMREQAIPVTLVNGTFDTDTGWIKGTGWTIVAGVASKTTDATVQTINQDIGNHLKDQYYRIVYTISNYDGGTIRPYIDTVFGTADSWDGTYRQYIKTNNLGILEVGFEASADFIGDIDNITYEACFSPWTTTGTDYILAKYIKYRVSLSGNSFGTQTIDYGTNLVGSNAHNLSIDTIYSATVIVDGESQYISIDSNTLENITTISDILFIIQSLLVGVTVSIDGGNLLLTSEGFGTISAIDITDGANGLFTNLDTEYIGVNTAINPIVLSTPSISDIRLYLEGPTILQEYITDYAIPSAEFNISLSRTFSQIVNIEGSVLYKTTSGWQVVTVNKNLPTDTPTGPRVHVYNNLGADAPVGTFVDLIIRGYL